MSDVVIRAENLGKKYLIGHEIERERYVALRDVLARTAKGFSRSFRRMVRGQQLIVGDEVEEFWALKDVSFEIKRGEVVGIIGRNGAGKSTLLKILSRITEPSVGRVEIRGRVASLLEVGTGFHPELTGRENIYLNGAILGMTRREIRRKFEEIVAFAEIEKFLDTPVKHYSSGMYLRLAFAVAAHLEPEILVIDEILAVGDTDFQRKCLGKMQDVAGHGRTVLFVSHNAAAVRSLCTKAILIKQGEVTAIGSAIEMLEQHSITYAAGVSYIQLQKKPNVAHSFMEVTLLKSEIVGTSLAFLIRISSEWAGDLIINIRIRDRVGTAVAMASIGGFHPGERLHLAPGESAFRVNISLNDFAAGQYKLSLDLETPFNIFHERLEDCVSFNYVPTPNRHQQRTLHQDWNSGYIMLQASVEPNLDDNPT